MLLSTSTTGILSLVVGLPLILVAAAARSDGKALGRLGKTAGVLLLGGAVALTPAFIMKPQLFDAVASVIDSTVNKGSSDSFSDRSTTDMAALDALGATYGLGVGWGSFRSSSVIPGLVANGGAFGLFAVLWLAARTVRTARSCGAAGHGHPGKLVVDGFSAGMCGHLTAALFSAPTISSMAFFMQLGCVVGISARMTMEPGLAPPPLLVLPPGGSFAR